MTLVTQGLKVLKLADQVQPSTNIYP